MLLCDANNQWCIGEFVKQERWASFRNTEPAGTQTGSADKGKSPSPSASTCSNHLNQTARLVAVTIGQNFRASAFLLNLKKQITIKTISLRFSPVLLLIRSLTAYSCLPAKQDGTSYPRRPGSFGGRGLLRRAPDCGVTPLLDPP